jgi:hypothetical protein
VVATLATPHTSPDLQHVVENTTVTEGRQKPRPLMHTPL